MTEKTRDFQCDARGLKTLETLGDHIAKSQKYRELTGTDALVYFLVEKYHWTPQAIRDMPKEDIDLLFEEIMPKVW